MSGLLLAVPDANVESDLTALLQEIDDLDIRGTVRSTTELDSALVRYVPDIVLLHEDLGPDPFHQMVRDVTRSRPGVAVVGLSPRRTTTSVMKAMEAGARGVIAQPFAFEDVQARLSAATDWIVSMRSTLEGGAGGAAERGSVLAVAGSKGGTGTTTVATHLAMDHLRNHPGSRVCVVDLDLEKGDVSALLDVRQVVSVADVAKVSDDMSTRSVADALVHHASGLHLLLAPADPRETEWVSPEALRRILTVLRRDFELVVLDCGGHVSPIQAAAIEVADQTLVVATADVLSVRALRKRMIAWSALGVREEAEFMILLNKVDKAGVFPASSMDKLTTATVLEQRIPVSTRLLEPTMNERDPRALTEIGWWRLMTEIRQSLGLERVAQEPPRSKRPWRRPAAEPKVAQPTAEAVSERGAIALEHVGLLPALLFVVVLVWHVAVTGVAFVYAGHASSLAAREYSVTGSSSEAGARARDAVPAPFNDGMGVSTAPDQVTVQVKVPASFAGAVGLPDQLETTRSVVKEP